MSEAKKVSQGMQATGLKGAHLSLQQDRLWSFQRESDCYQVCCALSLSGLLDVQSLEQAFLHLVEQHEILHTLFQTLPGMTIPVQVIASVGSVTCPIIDWQALKADQYTELLDLYCAQLNAVPFDMQHGPLYRLLLVRVSADTHILLISVAALCADSASLAILTQALGRVYTQLRLGYADTSDEEPLQYIDVSSWQNKMLSLESAEEPREFWRKFDVSQVSSAHLPFEQETSKKYGLPFGQGLGIHTVRVDAELAAQIKALSSRSGSSTSAVLLACWYILQWRLTDERSQTLGIACDGRIYEELAEVPGLYTRFVPITLFHDETVSFAQVVELCEQALQDAAKWQAYFSWPVQKHVEAENSSAFFPVTFAYNHWSIPAYTSDLKVSLLRTYGCTEPLRLKLDVLETDDELHLSLYYDKQCFTEDQIRRLAGILHTLVDSAVHSPTEAARFLPLLKDTDRRESVLCLPGRILLQDFEEQVRAKPEQLAVRCSRQALTYQQVNALANQLARQLRAQGVGPNVLVGLCLTRSVRLVVAVLAIWKAGGAYLPLDEEIPPARLRSQLRDSGARLLLIEEALQTMVTNALSDTEAVSPPVLVLDELIEQGAHLEASNLPMSATPSDLAYMIYTSGSTGQPKGVLVPHENLSAYAQAFCERVQVQPGWHFGLVSTLAADLGNTMLVGALRTGGCVHVLDYATLTSGAALARWQERTPLDVLKLVPSHLGALLADGQGSEVLPRQVLVLGGEAMSPVLLKRIWQAEGTCRVYNHYGPTETTIGVLMQELTPQEKSIALGRALAGSEVYVLDRFSQVQPVGVVGELCIGGEALAWGYQGRGAETAERFVPHPWRAGARLYRTGDQGYQDEQGRLVFVGRIDRQVKVRGYRIELAEIEAVLKEHPGVWDAVVVWQEAGPEGGEAGEGRRLVSYVVVREQTGPAEEELRAFVRERVPSYMVPQDWMRLAQLPLTANGKVDWQRLPRVETSKSELAEREAGVPRGPIEEAVSEIWRELLGRKEVYVEDNFFELGGHSLLATQMVARLRRVLGVELSVLSVFETPTVAGLARQVEQALRTGAVASPDLVSVQRRAEGMPLSSAQQRLWLLDQLEPGSVAYLLPRVLPLSGKLAMQALDGSVRHLIERHEILRTSFEQGEEEPVQRIHPVGKVRLPVLDLSGLREEERPKVARQLAREESQQPCDLSHGPLLRLSLMRLAAQEHQLLWTMHHIITDGWSTDIFVREITTLYRAISRGEASPLAPLPIQYADYAVWQRGWLQGVGSGLASDLETQLSYWQKQLAHLVPLEMPTDHPRPPVQTTRGSQLSFGLPLQLQEQLSVLSQQEGVTLFMLLLSAFQVLLLRYSGQSDLAIGTPIANRTRPEIEGLIGFFVNTLVMRTNLSGNPTFGQVLEQVRATALGAYAHQDVPFEMLVERLQPERDLSRTPLFQVMFSLVVQGQQEASNVPARERREEHLGIRGEIEVPVKFDLELTLLSAPHDFHVTLLYNRDLYEPARMQRLLQHYQTLLEAIVTDPARPVGQLPLLTEAERQWLKVSLNQTELAVPACSPLPELWEQVRRTPERVACSSGEGQLTYQALWQHASRLAEHLRTRGVGPERVVGVRLKRELAWPVVMLAIWLADGVYLPLDPAAPEAQVESILSQGQVHLLLTRRKWLAGLSSVPQSTLLLEEIEEVWQAQASPSIVNQMPPVVLGEQAAYVIYTSGSTGRPKGALLTHQGLLNHLWAKKETLQVQAEDVLAQTASHCFDISLWQVLTGWLVGGRVHLMSEEQVQDALVLLQSVQEQRISILEVVPVLLRALLDEVEEPEPWQVRWLLVTGEALSSELARRFWQRGWEAKLLNAYGPTECSDDVTHGLIRLGDGWERRPSAPIGRAISNTQLYVLDRWGELVPAGGEGELYVGGMGVGRGYVGEAERTAESFVPDGISGKAGARLYRTGDRCRLSEDGTLEFVRREDQQVKVRGYRIELGEIEAVLRGIDAVEEAVVQVQKVGSREEKTLVAYVQVREGVEGGSWEEQVRERVRSRLPGYMVPTLWVGMQTWPLNVNGKVDRKRLPVPEVGRVSEEQQGCEPEGWLAEVVRGIWQEVLGREEIGRDENFFELGGHSLLATQIMGRVRRQLGIDLPLRSLFEGPTLREQEQQIAQALREQQGVSMPELKPSGRRTEGIPLSYEQQRLWFLDRLDPGNTAYLVRDHRWLHGALNVAMLERSFIELMRRHESLRTSFQMHGDQPLQIIHATCKISLPLIDLRELSQVECENEVRTLVHQDTRLPFDLVRGPVLRTCLLRLAADKHALLLTMHHIVTDGWSLDILARELTVLYRAFVLGRPSPLSPLPIQYADYAVWQRQWLQGEALDTQLLYWKKRLAGMTPLKLPTDRPRPVVQSYRGAVCHFRLSPELSEALQQLSRQEGATLFMTLLAAFQVLLYRYSGQEDIAVGTDVANRNRMEIEGVIGFFINQLVLRTSLAGNPRFRELLRVVRSTALEAYLHQDLPFEKLVEAVQPGRNLQYSPIFQVKLLLQNALPEASLPHDNSVQSDFAVHPLALPVETVQQDLILRLFQTPKDLVGSITYSTDLFDAATIERMVRHFMALLESISANPDSRVNVLAMSTKEEKEKQDMQKKDRETATFSKFKGIKPKPISLEEDALIQTGSLQANEPLPLLIRPQQVGLDLVEWAKNNLNFIETKLLEHGAILFRDFRVSTPEEFERFALTICSELYAENGEHVPVTDAGSGGLYTPVFYAPEKKLLWHNENSFNFNWPTKILFFCARPADQGGETPIADSRKVFHLIDPHIREQFMRKGIMYVRNYGEKLGLSWQTVFRTTDKSEVEALCRKSAILFEWKDGDRLRTSQIRPAVIKHPTTADWVWWNQAAHWHPACLDQTVRDVLSSQFTEEELPRNCYYGDGSPIDDTAMTAICQAYEAAEISFPWQTGDILMLDNMLTAHARNPYIGKRKIYVSMGGMITLSNIQ